MNQPTIDLDEIVDRIAVMHAQERTSYSYSSYLPRRPDGTVDARLNVSWREKICQWSYNVVDHFDLSREVVAVSLNLFDRFLATRGNKCNGNLALLTSLTTLHIAIKLHDSKKIKLATLANLSRGQFGCKHIEDMEWTILKALRWKLHPPTQYAFVSHLIMFLPQEAHPIIRKEVFELSRYLTELAICDSFFVDTHNSTVAFAAIINVMEDMSYARLSAGIRERFLRELTDKIGLSYCSRSVIAARERLRTMFAATNTRDQPASNFAPASGRTDAADTGSLAGGSLSSCSNGSFNRARANSFSNRSRTSSIDSSKGSCRYSPSPRRNFVASVSPMGSSRAHLSASPIVAGVQ